MPPMTITIGERLKALRETTGLTQQSFATQAGISIVTLNRAETGRIEPSLVTLQRIADKLDITLSELLVDVRFDEQPSAPAAVADTA